MKNKIKTSLIILSILLLLLTSTLLLIPNVKGVETYGYEWCRYYYWNGLIDQQSKVKFQTHAVYVDTVQGGVCPYGMWIYGKNIRAPSYRGGASAGTYVKVRIYALAHYHSFNLKTGREEEYWGCAPSDLFQWNGEYDYDPSTPGTWRWTVGIAYYFTFSATYTPNAVSDWQSANSVSNGWRYLGYFISTHPSGYHSFHALLKLHIVNEAARRWRNGIEIDYYIVEWIDEIRVKLVFDFYWRYWIFFFPSWWIYDRSFTHILGDGALPSGGGGTDLNYIPLVSGEVG